MKIAIQSATQPDTLPDTANYIIESDIAICIKMLAENDVQAIISTAQPEVILNHNPDLIEGVAQPALASILNIGDDNVLLLDVGASSDPKPTWLQQFAIMGNAFAQSVLDKKTPRVGVLANGEEEGKGNQIVQEASQLIRELPLKYIGNTEPSDVCANVTDVVVTDGYTGAILLDTFISSTQYLVDIIRDELKTSVLTNIGERITRPTLNSIRDTFHIAEFGFRVLLGINGLVFLSSPELLPFSIEQAQKAHKNQLVDKIRNQIKQLGTN